MTNIPLVSLPDGARLWVFASRQPLPGEEAAPLLDASEGFVRSWLAHGVPVVGGYDWRYDHFLLIAADEQATGVSGCSIDSLFRALKAVESALGVVLLDSSPVWYRDVTGAVRCESRSAFRELVAAGEIGDDTIVFDNTVGTLGALRAGEWERPFAESWHARAFAPSRRPI